MIWYEFNPADSLFFKGSGPMVKGENHSALSHFPPAAETIAGSLRSEVLRQNQIKPHDYKNNVISEDLTLAIGKAGEAPPFYITGPFLKKADDILIPVPFTWYTDKESTDLTKRIYKAEILHSDLVKSSSSKRMWVKGQTSELQTLGGNWVKLSDFNSDNPICYPSTDFYEEEIRTGIELETTQRKVKKGHLYSFTHLRLNKDITLIFGINLKLPIKDEGILSLGGEKRFGHYQQVSDIYIPEGNTGLYIILSPVEADELANRSVLACGKIFYRGGWDLAKGFHKPMKGYFPAGSVFDKKIDENCIQL